MKKILVVEDDDLLRRTLAEQLSSSYVVAEAGDGEQALKLIHQFRPDVIALDLLLPVLDGFQVLKALRDLSDPVLAQTPVLVVSNLSDSKSIELAGNYKVLAYYTKAEVRMGTIVNRIKQLFEEKPQVDSK